MTGLVLGLALAVIASVALNGSYLLQHAGSRGAPAVDVRRPLTTARGLLSSGWWLAGAVAGMTGWAVHVAALSQAPLSLVQAFAVGGLALTVPVAARAFGQRLDRSEQLAVGALVAALALLGLGAVPAHGRAIPAGPLAIAMAAAAMGAAALALAPAGPRRAHLLGAAGGVLYGAADAATKAATGAAHAGLVHGLLSPWAAAVAVASSGAFFCFQRGLQIGPALPVIALMTAATNVVAVLGGLTVFGESLGSSAAFSAIHAGALVAVGLCAWRLAPAQARLADEPGTTTAAAPPPRRAARGEPLGAPERAPAQV
jgi:hypothetical protein